MNYLKLILIVSILFQLSCKKETEIEIGIVQLDVNSDLDSEINRIKNVKEIKALNILGVGIEHLDFLANLEEIGDLWIQDCHQLRSLSGLENVNIYGRLTIVNCDNLIEITK